MSSLVADYGTSSESERTEDSDSEEEEIEEESALAVEARAFEKLPGPDFGGSSGSASGSVFANPFADAENAATAILEKHVKMVSATDKRRSGDRSKTCWNHRKGRCKFGSNCAFVHDTVGPKSSSKVEGKKRPGLGDSVVPSGRVLKAYKRQKLGHTLNSSTETSRPR